MPRPSWDDYFFSLAAVAATRASCPRASVGVVLVDPRTHRVVGTGYNGAPSGDPSCDEVGCDMVDNHCVRSVHGEANAIAAAARHGVSLDGKVAYITAPLDVCVRCANLMISAGVIWKVQLC